MEKPNQKIIIWSITILFILQIGTSSYFIFEFYTLKNSLLETNALMNQNFDSVNKNINSIDSGLSDANNKINNLESSLGATQQTLSETQSSFESQISSLKAKTSSDFSGVISDVVKSVVSIKTNAAQGTGFIITNDGYVITNAHVLEGSTYAKAITAEQQTLSMSLVGYSSTLDLALLKINGTYNALTFADSNNVKVGEKVIAIGNPYGLSFSVSEGIVSATHRKVSGYGGEYTQTDAALNAGNSGGPLIDTDGKVIGINNFKIEGDNIGFALESDYIIDEVNNIASEKLGNTLI
jgi:S1-C subfamily serine protease